MHRNMEHTIVLINEGPGTHPWRYKWYMFMHREAMETGHPGTAILRREVERKRFRLTATSARVSEGMELQVREKMVDKVDTLK